ncbi:hypothetical protein [Cellulomonas xiejunii]|uniref:Secreted protein n=1 Tax=Cellulomonas xiejunii TaxID=2968083 RepID=A0ABY5KRL1_9CELL|nr:hypothetical protein [Cellulomonas xiejunii]MCC2322332.1 hypothetical protein [Cellulomonas xiejunii]UUI72384.1 hypothetical protein NP048_02630 [Cellulomonas xiejunii]
MTSSLWRALLYRFFAWLTSARMRVATTSAAMPLASSSSAVAARRSRRWRARRRGRRRRAPRPAGDVVLHVTSHLLTALVRAARWDPVSHPGLGHDPLPRSLAHTAVRLAAHPL